MGKEADCDAHGIDIKLGHMGLVSAPRTPLRALIASESAGSESPGAGRKRWESGSGRVKARGRTGASASPPPGSSSPKTHISQASHRIRVFKKAGVVVQAIAERPVQLGALFAQEREEPRGVAVEPHVRPLRDLIAAELDDHGVSQGRSPWSVEATKPADESQELRYLFAKDWALQTSDEEDEFWDSGSLCGAPMSSCHEKLRRRSRFSKNQKLSNSTTSEIVEVPELRVQSPGREFSKPGGTKSSLGTLLAEEIATSSGSPLAESLRWSVPAAESSRRVKIGSLDDISAPVRPESQSQLDSLIAKILTLRANSVTGNAEPVVTRVPGTDNGGCSASGSMHTQVREEVTETFSSGTAVTAPATDANSSIVDAPNILLMNPDVGDAPPTSTSTAVETPIPVSDAETRDDSEEASNPDGEDTEATPRVQLGTLLERTWGEHGWLPLGRSQMGSPLPAPSSSSRLNCEGSQRGVPSGRSSPERAPPAEAESVEATETVEFEATPARERPPTRVSLLSLLNQDMETDEDGLHADVCGCRDDEEDEVVTEELDPMCCVCMVGHKGAAFIPCGHTFCRKCCREVRRSIGSCPLCNQAIVDVLKLY